MKIATISDVHVKQPFDSSDQLLQKFLNHEFTKKAEYIFFLGDIFDLMCGPHDEYLKYYEHFFKSLEDLLKMEKKIFFIEGNHDVHLDKLFSKYFKTNKVIISQGPVIEMIDSKKYIFSHGDEYDLEDIGYHRYKKLILSPPLRFFANYLMPYKVLDFFGKRASQLSRKTGRKKFDFEKVRNKFRNGVEKKRFHENFSFIIGGHSHVQDMYYLTKNSIYINNGYVPITKSFIAIDDHHPFFISLE